MDKGFQPLESLEEADFTLKRVKQITKENVEEKKRKRIREIKQEVLEQAKQGCSYYIVDSCFDMDEINYFKDLGFQILPTAGLGGYVISWSEE